MESVSFLGRVGILFEIYSSSCGATGVWDAEGMDMMVAGVVAVIVAVELLGNAAN